MKFLFIILALSFLNISLVMGEFKLLTRSRGYNEAVDHLTLKIKDSNCKDFLSKGGLAENMRGGSDTHCLPIGDDGNDLEQLSFVGRCMNHEKDIILSIIKIQKKTYGDDKKKTERDFVQEQPQKKSKKGFYLTLRSNGAPLEFKVLHYGLEGANAYILKRPGCIKARNQCRENKEGESEHIVIDCEPTRQLESGSIGAHDVAYIEITKRNQRANTCRHPKGFCCKYVNANPTQGICSLYSRKTSAQQQQQQQQQQQEPQHQQQEQDQEKEEQQENHQQQQEQEQEQDQEHHQDKNVAPEENDEDSNENLLEKKNVNEHEFDPSFEEQEADEEEAPGAPSAQALPAEIKKEIANGDAKVEEIKVPGEDKEIAEQEIDVFEDEPSNPNSQQKKTVQIDSPKQISIDDSGKIGMMPLEEKNSPLLSLKIPTQQK